MIQRASSVLSKGSSSHEKSLPKHRFGISTLRGLNQPELSKALFKLIKQENHAIGAYENAGRESVAVARQLSDWGEETNDDAVSDISDKLAVLLAEVAEQEDAFAQSLEESRGVLKQIRDIESSVHPTRTQKQKIQDEIAKLKYKEPESPKLVTLEQELVRSEAQSLVAEAQLTNITRQKLKEAYDLRTAAIIERAQKQIILATNARELLKLIDDTPIVPGEERAPFASSDKARAILDKADQDLIDWKPNITIIQTSAHKLGANAMPGAAADEVETPSQATMEVAQQRVDEELQAAPDAEQKTEVEAPVAA